MSTKAVIFIANGKTRIVANPAPWTTLNEWIRSQPDMQGTKRMCGEGGCGACVVMLTEQRGSELTYRAVNSCLFPLIGVHGTEVTTVEGLGGSNLGKLHPIQERMVEHNASQCGFCTPGMVMNMYSLLSSTGSKVSAETVEHAFDGNICRCTGYRPILDAMKSLSVDQNPVDIEDLKVGCKGTCPGCPKAKPQTQADCSQSLHFVTQIDAGAGDGGSQVPATVEWYRPMTQPELIKIMTESVGKTVRFVGGDTGKGIYKDVPTATVYIDVKKVPGMSDISLSGTGELTLGGSVTLSTMIEFLEANAGAVSYARQLLCIIRRIANTPIRNSATWTGNFMLANQFKFVSDALTAFAALMPTLTVLSADGSTKTMGIEEFVTFDMTNKVLQSMSVPKPAENAVYGAQKVMKRHENSHAYANASFQAVITPATGVISGQPVLFYGGLQHQLYRATAVEKYLVGKSVFETSVLEAAMAVLDTNLPKVPMAASGSVEYRTNLAKNLLYKFFLQAAGEHATPANVSALAPIRSGTSSGTQSFDTDKSVYPLTEPVPKLEIRAQTTGEAVYVPDLPIMPGQLYGHFVLATQAPATLDSIDSSEAQTMPGVVHFISAADIPGKNAFSQGGEEIFVSSQVGYVGQAIGMVIADSEYHAAQAAKAVTAKYTSTGKPLVNIQEAIAAQSFHDGAPKPVVVGDVDTALAESKHRVQGSVSCGSQHHLHMETQTSLCVPLEDGMDVFSSTQNIAGVHSTVATALGVDAGSVNVSVKRLGGGFGGKLSRCFWVAGATAIAAKLCKKPVMVHTDIDTNLAMIGKRYPWCGDYEIGFDDDGLIKGVKMAAYADAGYIFTDSSIDAFLVWIDNTYNIPAWNVTPKVVKTSTAANTYCRAPGSVPAMFFMETMIEHVAAALGKSPDDVRLANFYKKGEKDLAGQPLTYWNVDQLWSDIRQSAEVATREAAIEEFNKANRWRKRGLSSVPVKFGLDYFMAPFSSHVAVFGGDGTVAISHAGIEMGQGINTKVAQVAASILGVSVASIHVKAATSLNAANTSPTGGSIGSEIASKATMDACNQLKQRIDTSTESLPETATWMDRVKYCAANGIDLSQRGWYKAVHTNNNPFAYNCYGVMCTEVELDVLTGETNVARLDVLYDCGRSVNPEIDVGQIEGAVVMGLGYWLTEEMLYDTTTGANLTHNTWEYKPPMCLDIPQDMRVSLLKDSPNPLFVLKSKAVGEPPQVMACSALFAAKHCIDAALQEYGVTRSHFNLSGPGTPDVLQPLCQPPVQKMTI